MHKKKRKEKALRVSQTTKVGKWYPLGRQKIKIAY